MHLHIGFIEFLVFLAYYLIAAFLLRMASIRWADKPAGKALAVLHG